MRILVTSIFLFFFAPLHFYSQESVIKKIIYDDLYDLNHMYDGCIIQLTQDKAIISGNNTIRFKHTTETLRDSSDSRVSIVNIDSTLNFYSVEVQFDLISGFSQIDLFTNTFKYVLYRSGDKYYKVNGFLISEILFLPEPAKRIIKRGKIDAPTVIFAKHIRKRNIIKISKYLFVSVLKQLNQYGSEFGDNPYVKDIVCYANDR